MAGFVMRGRINDLEFHIDDEDVRTKIKKVASHPRAVTVQLDGDELEAFFWGLENYKKTSSEPKFAWEHQCGFLNKGVPGTGVSCRGCHFEIKNPVDEIESVYKLENHKK